MKSLSLGDDDASTVFCGEEGPCDSTASSCSASKLSPRKMRHLWRYTQREKLQCSQQRTDGASPRTKFPDDIVDALVRVLRASFQALFEGSGIGYVCKNGFDSISDGSREIVLVFVGA